MLVSLLQHERIKTTLAKGKELRSWADKMISLGKQGTLHARRRAFALLRDRGTIHKLFDEIAPKFKDRGGGYTRIYRLGWRQGDGAPLSLVELATYALPEEKKKSTIKKAKEVIEKVTPKKKEKAEKKGKVEKKEKEKERVGEKKEKKVKKVEKEAPTEKKEKPKKKASAEKSK
jgi:large subunit ribosomal protein L17